MPGIARGDGRDTVTTEHGCASTTTTNLCSTTVFVDGIGVARVGDRYSGCGHISTGSETVFAD